PPGGGERLRQHRLPGLGPRAYGTGAGLLAGVPLGLCHQRVRRLPVERPDVGVEERAVLGDDVEVAGQRALALRHPHPDSREAEPVPHLVLAYLALAEERLGVLVDELCERRRLLLGRSEQLDAHAATSASVSGSCARSVSSRVGFGSALSPSRLIQIDGRPSSFAGAMSWKRLAATCASGIRPAS